MPLTLSEAKIFLTAQGISLPEFVIQIFLDETTQIDECLALNYSEGTAKLIKLYLMTLMSVGSADKYISSESAPSGASRSYRYAKTEDKWNALSRALAGLDPKGCATALIPPSPFEQLGAAFFVVGGGCGCV